MRLGNTNLRLVSDGEHWVDGAGMFGLIPKTEWREMAEPDEQNRVRTQLYCLLIETEEQKILVDTGYGDKLSDQEREFIRLEGDGRLLASLAASGVAPEDVDMVINTHLHGDHCGGNTRYNEKGDLVPTFPNALYYVQRIELADAMFPNERTRGTYHRENLDSVERAGQLRVQWGDTRLTDEVRVLVTPGHTPAHQCVVIESVDTVVFRPISEAATRAAELEAGGVHLIQDVLPDQMDDLEESGHVVVPDEAFQLQYVFFITDDETLPTYDLKVRQALNYAVDVDAIIENLLASLGSRIASPIGPGYLGYNPDVSPYPYDPQKARDLLAEAGYADGFETTLDTTAAEKNDVVEAVTGYLSEVGVTVEIQEYELGQFNQNWMERAQSMLWAARWGNTPDPQSIELFASSNACWYGVGSIVAST